ncbi:MAG TPA: glycoside hydrolase family 88 protein [Pyrinomonadaceae bacterium]|nr:glycoside hydrolase family 88 protein [Pyrinomonadaceae bacterium]
MRIIKISLLISFLAITVTQIQAQPKTLSERLADTAMTRWKDSWELDRTRTERWSYDQGVLMKGIEGVWYNTANADYFRFIQRSIDRFVNDDGSIKTYKLDEYNIDHVLNGRLLLMLYKVTERDKYRKAAELLRQQLKTHPRTSEGGFWHKKIYPSQMWLDGLYMGEPFYAEYAALYHEDADFDDIAKQFILMETHARDPKTGLLYHGWDESKQQRWANPKTGVSPNFWARAMGWYGMALVDTLDYFPKDHPKRDTLIGILNRLAVSIKKYQSPRTGLWYDVIDKGSSRGNYFEASASCMFVYALAKGIRQGYLAPYSFLPVAQKGYQGITQQFIQIESNGQVNLKGTVSVSGLGGNPYRDGSYDYYLSEKIVTNDTKGMGAFLMASTEMDLAAGRALGKGRTVLLDSYFNNETKKDFSGRVAPFHYKWEEMPNSGFSLWARIWRSVGMKPATLNDAPTAENLRQAAIYIIVDPDTKDETSDPHFIEPQHIKAITNWVRAGGVLVMLGNDVGNSELEHFSELGHAFGIEFNKDSRNRVPGVEFAKGLITVPDKHPIFSTSHRLYLKEVSTLAIKAPAAASIKDKDDVIMAVSKLGKGTVFVLGDPWLYNEYVDGRKLPPDFENFKAARDLSKWLVLQIRK